jgi:hypothetical protein
MECIRQALCAGIRMVRTPTPVRKLTMPNDLQLDSDRVVTVEGAPASRVKTRTERYRAERRRTAEVICSNASFSNP